MVTPVSYCSAVTVTVSAGARADEESWRKVRGVIQVRGGKREHASWSKGCRLRVAVAGVACFWDDERVDDPHQKMMLLMMFALLAILGLLAGLHCWCRCWGKRKPRLTRDDL